MGHRRGPHRAQPPPRSFTLRPAVVYNGAIRKVLRTRLTQCDPLSQLERGQRRCKQGCWRGRESWEGRFLSELTRSHRHLAVAARSAAEMIPRGPPWGSGFGLQYGHFGRAARVRSLTAGRPGNVRFQGALLLMVLSGKGGPTHTWVKVIEKQLKGTLLAKFPRARNLN